MNRHIGRQTLTALAIVGTLISTTSITGVAFAQSDINAEVAARTERLSPREMEALLAPVALYPDQLLAQVLMAATYPYDVTDAADWSRANDHAFLRGDDLVFALGAFEWDASVKTLAQFPDVLRMMRDEYEWTVRVGNAFLLQEREVMDAIQRLRHQARAAGQLYSSATQRVYLDDGAVIIEAVNPQVVHVPVYNPVRAYGAWAYSDVQPYYFRRPVMVTRFVIVPSMWGWSSWDWHRHRIRVDLHRYKTFQPRRPWRFDENTWRHDPRRVSREWSWRDQRRDPDIRRDRDRRDQDRDRRHREGRRDDRGADRSRTVIAQETPRELRPHDPERERREFEAEIRDRPGLNRNPNRAFGDNGRQRGPGDAGTRRYQGPQLAPPTPITPMVRPPSLQPPRAQAPRVRQPEVQAPRIQRQSHTPADDQNRRRMRGGSRGDGDEDRRRFRSADGGQGSYRGRAQRRGDDRRPQ